MPAVTWGRCSFPKSAGEGPGGVCSKEAAQNLPRSGTGAPAYPPKIPKTRANTTATAQEKVRAVEMPRRGSIFVTPTAMTA
jgi:hypothetical protein